MRFLANLLTAGDEAPIVTALNRLIAMRSYQRGRHVEGRTDDTALAAAGLSEAQAQEMYRLLAIADYEDRFVIPTAQEELRQEDAYAFQGVNGFTFGNVGANGTSPVSLFPDRRTRSIHPITFVPRSKLKV